MDARLLCPITLNAVDPLAAPDAVFDAAVNSSFTVLAASASSVVTSATSGDIPETLCLGCKDGSTLLLRASPISTFPRTPPPLGSTTGSEPSSQSPRLRAQQLSTNGSSLSGSSKRPHLSYNAPQGMIIAPTRAVSDLNAVPVEAPKAFVQHDDEEGKLRALLAQSGQGRETPIQDIAQRPLEKTVNLDGESRSNSLERGTVKPMKSQLIIKPSIHDISSPASTRSSSPISRSRHASSIVPPTLPYRLLCHILPSQTGPNQAVAALEYLSGDKYFLVLQESG